MKYIKIKNLSKSYCINPFSLNRKQSSLRDDITKYFYIPSGFFPFIMNRLTKKPLEVNMSSLLAVYHQLSRKYTAKKILKKVRTKETFWALKNISITFKQGDIVGIIGKNGSGKSTLLKVIAGITPPTKGEIHIQGKVTALLGIGVGFHTDLTGKENIFLSGTLLGFRKKDLEKELHNIITFSGIEKFINTPVKFYSSGMYARLAFSIATSNANTGDIFLIDEVLAVGDEAFKEKSLNRIKELSKDKKKIFLLVSHERSFIENLCKTCLWLEDGKVKAYGKPNDVFSLYMNSKK